MILVYDFEKRLNKIPEIIDLIEWDKHQLMWNENCIIKPAGLLINIYIIIINK